MKSMLLAFLLLFILFFTSCEQEACDSIPSCAQPVINTSIQLNLDLSRFSEEELSNVFMVRTDIGSGDVIDTLNINSFNGFEDEILIGGTSSIPFNRELIPVSEFSDTDFKILIGSPAQEFTISDIRVMRIEVECSCPFLQFQSLRFNNDLIEINDISYTVKI